jgi:hypothetical protein
MSQLETVFAGVAGARDENIPGKHAGERRERLAARCQRRERLPGFVPRPRPLHGNHGEIAPLGQTRVESALGDVPPHPRHILRGDAGVYHDAIMLAVEAVDDEIIDHAAFAVQHAGIKRFARRGRAGEPRDVVGEQDAQPGRGVEPFEIERQHVGDVEHPGVAPHGVMLLDLGTVIDRHAPADEIDHARARGEVQGVKRRAQGRERGGIVHENRAFGQELAKNEAFRLAPSVPCT